LAEGLTVLGAFCLIRTLALCLLLHLYTRRTPTFTDMTPEDFSAMHLPNALSTLAQLTGTPADQWKATIAAKTALRSLLQVCVFITCLPAAASGILYGLDWLDVSVACLAPPWAQRPT
jgi:hypothetical protein